MRSNLAGCIWQNSTRKEWNFKISRFSADIVEFKILKFICSAQQNGILKFLANYKIQKQAKLNLCRATEFRDKSHAAIAKFLRYKSYYKHQLGTKHDDEAEYKSDFMDVRS